MRQIKSRKHLKQPITRISANEEPGRCGFKCGHVISLAEGPGVCSRSKMLIKIMS